MQTTLLTLPPGETNRDASIPPHTTQLVHPSPSASLQQAPMPPAIMPAPVTPRMSLPPFPPLPLVAPVVPLTPITPVPPVTPPVRATSHASKIEGHELEARRLRLLADALSDTIRDDAKTFSSLMQRWRALVSRPQRAQPYVGELAQIEQDIAQVSQRLAGERKQWTTWLAQAREHEAQAQRMRAESL